MTKIIMDNSLYYCFISHNSVVLQDYDCIKDMMYKLGCNNYFIFYGGKRQMESDRIIHLECDDSYCGLSDKINKMCKYLALNNNIKHILKIDRTVKIHKLINTESLHNINYCGKIIKFSIPTYHFNRCEKTSKWYNKEFNGESILYCSGGGYILSKRSVDIMAKDKNYENHVYEDYYVGSTLKSNDILPTSFPIKEYFYDPDHVRLFS